MSGVMAMTYIAMASGSPCVVTFWEKMVSPSMYIEWNVLAIRVDECFGQRRTKAGDISEGNLAVERVECVTGVS